MKINRIKLLLIAAMVLICAFAIGTAAAEIPAEATVQASEWVVNFSGQPTQIKWTVYTFNDEMVLQFDYHPEATDNVAGTVLYGTDADGNGIGYGNRANLPYAAHRYNVKKIVIGDGITAIDSGVCLEVSNATVAEFPATLTSIKGPAFESCRALKTIYVAGNEPVEGTFDFTNIVSIGSYTFDGCPVSVVNLSENYAGKLDTEVFKSSKIVEMTVPAGVTSIGKAFVDNTSLKKLTILGMETTLSTDLAPASTVSGLTIEAYAGSAAQAFAEDLGLKFIDYETKAETDYAANLIPDVESVGKYLNAFYGLKPNSDGEDTYTLIYLSKIATPGGISNYEKISERPWDAVKGKITQVVIRGEATILPGHIFADLYNLHTLYLTEKVTVIDGAALCGTGVLKTIVVGEATEPTVGVADLSKITDIRDYAFSNGGIENVILSESLSNIGNRAFENCTALKAIDIPASVRNIGSAAFMNCSALADIVINTYDYTYVDGSEEGTVASFAGIGTAAETRTLKGYEDHYAFDIAEKYGYEFISIGKVPTVFSGSVTQQYAKVDWSYDTATKVLTVKSQEGVTDWNEAPQLKSFLSKYITEVEEIIYTGRIQKLGGGVVAGATNLKKITIPTMCGQINNGAFTDCKNLTTIAYEGYPVMEGVINLYFTGSGKSNSLVGCKDTFKGCENATALVLSSGYNADDAALKMENLPANIKTIYGNSAYLAQFCADNGLTFIPFGIVDSNAHWTIDTETSTMTLDGATTVTTLKGVDNFVDAVKHVVVPESVTSIADDAFAAFTALETATFEGDAPEVGENGTPFGTQSAEFKIIVDEFAAGFEGDTWNGYAIEVTVYEQGDINCDGEVNTKDAVLLAQVLAGWTVEYTEAKADLNGDALVNTKDAVRLAQFLAGWDVELVGPPENGDIEIPSTSIM